ncbi:Uma2 family endonuclease [Egbenema bharatensis]|uniref:Uma2 family endonuclease n=1 Tax=Egbenema bharatensis TaxID=3463334 RepID=UPI003A855DEC
MVASKRPVELQNHPQTHPQKYPLIHSLEDWLENPPERTEWVDESLVEKNGMTLKHSRVQSKLARCWGNYKESNGSGGEVYTEAPCRTQKQGRSPDVAYLTPELVAQYGDGKVLPQSFPLTAEIVSPTDLAEDLLAKALEYLESGGEEVWLVYPEVRWIMVITADSRQIFVAEDEVKTRSVLHGFRIGVDELLG